MIDAPLVRVEPFAAQMAMPVSLLPYPPLLGIAFDLPASFFHDGKPCRLGPKSKSGPRPRSRFTDSDHPGPGCAQSDSQCDPGARPAGAACVPPRRALPSARVQKPREFVVCLGQCLDMCVQDSLLFAHVLDAPICQDSRSRSQVCGLARSVVCHHALKNLAGEKAFETADDLPFGPPFSGASFDVVEGW